MGPAAVSRRSPLVESREGTRTEGSYGSFSESVAKLLDRIDYRRADTAEAREAIFRLRYQAYVRDGTIAPNATGTFRDPYDDTDNVYLFGLYVDGVLASAIRLHVASREHPYFPTLDVFPEYLQPQLDAGKVIVDPTRFVADERLSRIHRALPYATLRLCGMCARYFRADELLAAVRVEHQAFYRRIFQHHMVCAPRPYPLLAKPISLMTIDYPAVAEDVHRRYPFFRSTLFERRMAFERAPVAVGNKDKLGQDSKPDLNQALNKGLVQDRQNDRGLSPDRPPHDRVTPFAEFEIACGA
jgi:N-acyl-L-homoserine lactone synthetase